MSGKAERTKRTRAPAGSKRPMIQAPGKRVAERSAMPRVAAVGVGIAAVVAVLYFLSSQHKALSGSVSDYPYAVGSPGVGRAAPPVSLPSTTGGSFSLASYNGKKPVLLYFQEGLTCQPCWDQISAIQKEEAKFHALGIGPIVSITTDPLKLIRQKAHDDGLTIPVLSDQGGHVSDTYSARDYGMMGHDRDGHSFVLVGKNGKIVWRADYGGAPKYTMFVPANVLIAQLKTGTGGKA